MKQTPTGRRFSYCGSLVPCWLAVETHGKGCIMKTRMEIGLLVCVVLFSGPASVCVYGQAPVITSFHQNGELTWSGPAGTNAYRVEWASDLTGTPTWYRNWWDLKYIVSAAPVTAASVPMFYRVVQDVNEYSNASLSNAWFVVMPVESIYHPACTSLTTMRIARGETGSGPTVGTRHRSFWTTGPCCQPTASRT